MKSLLAKMLLVQKALKPVPKDETNPHFKSKYFDINGLVAQLRPVLNDAGLVVTQAIDGGAINTVVADPESGESMSSSFPLPELGDPQKLGGAITYFRRYALTSLFLIDSEDDDGNAASQAQPAAQPAAKPYQAPMSAPASLGTCKDCGAGNAWSAGKQKAYCSAKCWLNPAPAPAPKDAFDQAMEAPF